MEEEERRSSLQVCGHRAADGSLPDEEAVQILVNQNNIADSP